MLRLIPTLGGSSTLAMGLLKWIVLVLALLYLAYALTVVARYLKIRRAARDSGAPLGLRDLIAMRWRKVDPVFIIEAYDEAHRAGLDLTCEQIEHHLSQGGDVNRVIEALIIVNARGLRDRWKDLCRRDLSGENVLKIVKKRVEQVEAQKRELQESCESGDS